MAAAMMPRIIVPAVCTPQRSLTAPKARENGRNTIQLPAPTVEETPDRMSEGMASCSRRVRKMPMAIASSGEDRLGGGGDGRVAGEHECHAAGDQRRRHDDQ